MTIIKNGLNEQQGINSKKMATVWLNVGQTVGDNFIQLPVGLPLDTMKDNKVPYDKETDFAQRMLLGNQLKEQLLAKAEALEEGESCTVKLEVVLYKVRPVDDTEVEVHQFDL